ncbi:MAG: tetratricopeptide repeat protein [Candidatus Obscuribacterales bacterium]|nr:tetratricopeptide repeat protein [Candidatus Obscuribacterales bacterium]
MLNLWRIQVALRRTDKQPRELSALALAAMLCQLPALGEEKSTVKTEAADSAKSSPAAAAPKESAGSAEFEKQLNAGLNALKEGKAALAEQYLKSTLKLEEAQGASEIKRLKVMILLADLYRAARRYPEAEALYKQVLAKYNKNESAPELAALLSKLAGLYKSGGRLDEALELYKKALEVSEKQQGPESAAAATSHANLALLYFKMGKAKDGELEENNAIALFNKKLGLDSAETAQCKFDLATEYMAEHKIQKAIPLLEEALAIFSKNSQYELSCATCADELGTAYTSEGRYKEAEDLARKAMAIYQKRLGPQSLELAVTLSNLGYRLASQGKNQEALESYNKSIAIQEKALGPDSTDLLANLHGIAEVYVQQLEYKKAEAILRRDLALRQKRWGEKNPGLVPAMKNLANCLVLEGAAGGESELLFSKAESILAELPAAKRKTLDELLAKDILKGLDISTKKSKKQMQVW